MVATLARYDCTDVEHSNTFFNQKTFFSIDLNSIRPRFQLRSELVVRAAGLRITRERWSYLIYDACGDPSQKSRGSFLGSPAGPLPHKPPDADFFPVEPEPALRRPPTPRLLVLTPPAPPAAER